MLRESGASSIPEASRGKTSVSGILDRPIKSGDDTELVMALFPGITGVLSPDCRQGLLSRFNAGGDRFACRAMHPRGGGAIVVIALSWESVKGARMGSDAGSEESPERRFRTLFISDVHLGARGSQADKLLDFLRTHDADTIYLVGDIVDGWALKSNWFWPQSHNDFVQKMLRKARKGAKVIYIPGNHDEFLRNYYGTHFGGIDVVENAVHTGVDGKRFLVIHGDIFDLVVQNARWLAHLGDKAYDFAIQMNRFVNFFRRLFGVPYWSLSQWAKRKVKNAVNYIGAFEAALAAEARRHGADGVICGHIHYAVIRDEHGVRYMNCGDWVESCTALVEHEDGQFEIITWSDLAPREAPAPQVASARAA
jgi:UDP-2,3-diacylglucosamine pyrophosphatase LpxH